MMAGGLLLSNKVSGAPSTVMKKSGSLSGLVGSDGCSLKYRVRAAVAVALARPANRSPDTAATVSVTGNDVGLAVSIVASGLVGSTSPSGPVLTLRVWKTARCTDAEGPVTM